MNYIVGLLFVLLAAKGCEEQAAYQTLDYEASTRGYYSHIKVDGNKLTVDNNRDGSDKVTKELSASEVNELNRLVQAFVITTPGDIENPSNAADTDAAIPVRFVIKGASYSRTAEFDKGSPPAKLAPLVGRLLLLADTL